MSKYWEQEEANRLDTGANVLRWFAQAGKLQVSTPDWTRPDGKIVSGKTVTLNLDAVRETDGAIEFLQSVIDSL